MAKNWIWLVLIITGVFAVLWILIWFIFFPVFTRPASGSTEPIIQERFVQSEDKEERVTVKRDCDTKGNCRIVRTGYNPICVGRKKGEEFKCKPPGYDKEVEGCRCD